MAATREARFSDDPTFRDRYYVKEPPIQPMPPIAGPNSIAHKLMPPKQVVKNMNRLRHDEFASWNGIAALRTGTNVEVKKGQHPVEPRTVRLSTRKLLSADSAVRAARAP